MTVLMWATRNGNADVVMYLLHIGADTQATDKVLSDTYIHTYINAYTR